MRYITPIYESQGSEKLSFLLIIKKDAWNIPSPNKREKKLSSLRSTFAGDFRRQSMTCKPSGFVPKGIPPPTFPTGNRECTHIDTKRTGEEKNRSVLVSSIPIRHTRGFFWGMSLDFMTWMCFVWIHRIPVKEIINRQRRVVWRGWERFVVRNMNPKRNIKKRNHEREFRAWSGKVD